MNCIKKNKTDIDYFFYPDGVAVIGATENPMKGGFHIIKNVLEGYKGRIYPVSPNYTEIEGTRCYPDIQSIPDNIELVIYFISAGLLPETIRQCAKKGVKGIIIESAGFSEVGEEGKKLQNDSLSLARELGIRLWGPNCMGLLDAHSRHVFSFTNKDSWKTRLIPGSVSLIVQSGMLSSGFLMMMLERGGMGISKVASIGNKCDIDETGLLEYYINDPNTGVIGCYLESIKDGRRFMDLARGTAKPIVVLKAGRSPQGARAALSHTASLSGESKIYSGAFKQAGIVQVYDVHELMDFVRGFSKTDQCSCHGGTAVMTFSGGAGIVTADLLNDNELKLAELSRETLSSIKEVFPQWMDPSNPADLWPAVEKNGLARVYVHTLEALLKDESVDAVIVEALASSYRPSDYLKQLGELKKAYNKPVVLWMIGTSDYSTYMQYRTVAEDAGIPEFSEIGRAASFLRGMRGHFAKKRSLGLIS